MSNDNTNSNNNYDCHEYIEEQEGSIVNIILMQIKLFMVNCLMTWIPIVAILGVILI